jgi:hypothetical protein
MIRKVNLAVFVLIFAFSTGAYSQVFVTKSNGKKTIRIDKNDRIKITFKTDRKFNGIYIGLLYGKHTKSRYGKLLTYTDSTIVVRSRNRWLTAQTDTIPVDEIIAINRYNPYLNLGVTIVAAGAILAVITSSAVVDSQFVLLYFAGGIVGFSIIDDLCIFPRKNIEKKKWSIIVKNE